MEFKDELKKFVERIETVKDMTQTEEATKMSLIVPFFQLLGYDVFNPLKFCPEYTADVGIKKGEKVDYAILSDGKPIILIEAKASNKKLDKHSSQLFRYFVTTPAKFAILTNGIEYKFYTDLDESNKMDKAPFLEVNLLHLKEHQFAQIAKFREGHLDIDEILESASLLKYSTIFRSHFEQQLKSPSDDFVKLFLQPVYKGTKTQAVIEKFRPILVRALNDYINESLNEKMQAVSTSCNEQSYKTAAALTENDQWDILPVLKEILSSTIDTNKIVLKHTGSYTAVLYENNVRKWICRLSMTGSQNILVIPDENKKELKYPIETIEEVKDYSEQIIEVALRYLHPAPKYKEILYTRWGNYEMPDSYKTCLARGPRTDLREIDA